MRLTIGKVSKSVIESKGIEGEELFDNYKAQKSEEEKYMCVETGIGSGSVYDVSRIHRTSEEAKEKLAEIIKLNK